MSVSRIMSTLKILTDLCPIRQKIRTKNAFADIACNALVVKKVLVAAEGVWR